ncbi:homoserine kinase [Thiomicrospira microaerophila]|uniref:homoserine kinase n=1 Tax=Thiomicrospira microaerophila TaxID=406020 RepID=UPI00200D69E5|nr:homoserine kinase [Thiomicrospira microaerophila]UQB42104.1 homoserine kinase [Thiomicrospira microaerophila]
MSVYTLIERQQLSEFLNTYDVGSLVDFEGISAGIENTNYFVDTEKGRFVLTIFEHHCHQELGYFLDIMAFMAEHQIPTAHPKADLEGHYLKTLAGKPAALVERLKGKTLDHPNQEQCEVMAQALAKFHLAGMQFDRYRANDRDLNWAQAVIEQIKDLMSADDQVLAGNELAFQATVDWTGLPQSVIHADLFTDNAMFEGSVLTGIIDLYYACHGACLYDLAVMVNDWCRNSDNCIDFDKLSGVLAAYQRVRPLTEVEHSTWNAALRMASFRFWLSRLKDKLIPREGEMTMIKDPAVFRDVLVFHRKNR